MCLQNYGLVIIVVNKRQCTEPHLGSTVHEVGEIESP